MTVRTVNNLPAAAHGETVRCLFAIELSKQSWVIGFTTPLSAKISRRILSGGDWKGLLELIEEVRARVSREICYEAGYDGFWLHRQAPSSPAPSAHRFAAAGLDRAPKSVTKSCQDR
jgi:transposase